MTKFGNSWFIPPSTVQFLDKYTIHHYYNEDSGLNNDLCHTSTTPPSPTYNVGSVNESQSHLMLLMLKIQHTQIPNIVSGGEGRGGCFLENQGLHPANFLKKF